MTARALAVGVLAAAALTACGSSPGGAAKSGAPPGPTVLRLATPTGNLAGWPSVRAFAAAVERRSGGRLRVEVVPEYGGYAADAEQQVVRGVARRDVDLGWVRSGVFDALGVTSLQALTAPMLITSFSAKAAVLRSELPVPMLAGVRATGVVGLALLADELRRPFGVSAPLLAPSDYRGLVLGAYPSRATAAALRALGATTTNLWTRPLLNAIDRGQVGGFERTLRTYTGDVMAGSAPYATANVALWPQVLVLIANPEMLAGLPGDQRRWVERAAADASAVSLALPSEEPRQVATACEQGGRFSIASPAQIRALRAAFAPAVTALERDAPTRAAIARIRALVAGASADVPLSIPADCTGAPPGAIVVTARSSPLDGVYRWSLSDADQKHDPYYVSGVPSQGLLVFTISLARQRWRLHERYADGSPDERHEGTFSVEGDRVSFVWGNAGQRDVFRFRRTPDGVRLTGVTGDPGDLFVWGYNPWRKIE